MPKCRICGAEIVFVETVSGKRMPCNPEIFPYWAQHDGKGRVVTFRGEVLPCTFKGDGPATGLGYVPHWATCGRDRQTPEIGPGQLRLF